MTIEYATKMLCCTDPFWGLYLMTLNKRKDNSIPTLAVAKEGNGAVLLINQEFWNSLTDAEQFAVLKHELHHIAFGHIFMGDRYPDPIRRNVAMDMEVNSYIDNLPNGSVLAKDYNLKDQEGTKYYYDNLPEEVCTTYIYMDGDGDPQKSNNGRPKPFDDHSKWKSFSDLSEAEQEVIKQSIESGLVEAAKQCKKTMGTVPSEIAEVLDELLKEKPRIYDWKTHFRRVLGNEIETKFKKTFMRESKRFSAAPGLKFKKKVKILVGIDTSGSVSDNELVDFFSEINHIYKSGSSIYIIECDTVIHGEWDYKGMHNIKITGRGGTDFQPMVDYYRNHLKDYTGFVIFTDGGAPVEHLNVPRNDMLWVITSDGEHKEYPGKVIYIPSSNN